MTILLSQLTLPAVSPEGLKALEITSRPEPDIKELERTLLRDPVLASTVVKYANSPLYRRPNKVANVPAAVRVLGLKNIRSAVVMATMRAVARPDNPVNRSIWGHSIDIALLCKLIARATSPGLVDDLEFIGLIHDMGMLVLANSFPQEYTEILRRSRLEETPVDLLEQEVFGTRHDAVIAPILERFRIPEHYIELLSGYHSHAPITSLESDTQRYLAVLDLAHHLWRRFLPRNEQIIETIVEPLEALQRHLPIGDDFMEEVFAQYTARTTDAAG